MEAEQAVRCDGDSLLALSGRVSALKVHLLRRRGYVVTCRTSPLLSAGFNLCCRHPGASGGSVQRCSLEVLFAVCLLD